MMKLLIVHVIDERERDYCSSAGRIFSFKSYKCGVQKFQHQKSISALLMLSTIEQTFANTQLMRIRRHILYILYCPALK